MSTSAPVRASAPSRLALATILTTQLMIVLDATIVNVALPHIHTALGFSPTSLSWVINAYTLAFGGLLLLGARAGDLLGRRRMLMAGIGLFVLASFLGGFAQTETQLLRVNISNLRRKIEPNPARPIYVSTEPGVGYRLRMDE